MIKFKGVVFKDDVTGKEITVDVSSHTVNSEQKITPDERFACIFNAGLIASGGFETAKEFYTK